MIIIKCMYRYMLWRLPNVFCLQARKLIAKNPSLCTIIEEGEEIGANEVDYTNDF